MRERHRGERQSVQESIFESRLRWLLFVVTLLVSVVGIGIIRVAVVAGPRDAESARLMRELRTTVYGRRGTIYDRNGNILAMSERCSTVCCDPSKIHEPYVTADFLAEVLGGDSSDYVDILTRSGSFAYIAHKIDNDVADTLMAGVVERGISGIYVEDDMRRVHPYGAVGSQVIGIVGADGKGISGLELYYDDVLSGTNGTSVVEVGLGGVPIADAEAEIKPAKDGTDIVISLDIDVQRYAESVIVEGIDKYKSESGSVVVMVPSTGEILAACSTPLFDVTDLSSIPDGATSLKPVSSSYEPGSIFKILTASIAIDSKSLAADARFTVPPAILVGEDYVTDVDERGESMEMDLREILRRSSNVGSAQVAQDCIGADTFAAGVETFGIGHTTGIDYPGEVSGIVKARDEYDGSTLGSMAFGQGLSVPAIQMVHAVGIVANQGCSTVPHFLVKKGMTAVEWPEDHNVISRDTCDVVTDMLCTVMDEGTGVAGQVNGYTIAGKTGTGEQSDTEHGGYSDDGFMSSLIGYAPAKNPKALVYVGLNGTSYHASDSSATLFASLMQKTLADLNVYEGRSSVEDGEIEADSDDMQTYDDMLYDDAPVDFEGEE